MIDVLIALSIVVAITAVAVVIGWQYYYSLKSQLEAMQAKLEADSLESKLYWQETWDRIRRNCPEIDLKPPKPTQEKNTGVEFTKKSSLFCVKNDDKTKK